MKVAIINRSDLLGGAAIFTYRLMQALRLQGVDATMIVCDCKGNDSHVVSYADSCIDRFHFLAERIQIFCNNNFSKENLFKVDTARWGRDISLHPVVKEADVIMLNWVNQGALSLSCIEKLCDSGKPVVWTMHDMWQCTGICHHAYDCNRYEQHCGQCPYLTGIGERDLSYRVWKQKKNLYDRHNIQFVAVSNWLAEVCGRSSLLRDKPVVVIPNCVDVEKYQYTRLPNSDYSIPAGKCVLVMGAARLDDPVKGFDTLVATTQWMSENNPSLADNIHLLLFGDMRNTALLQQLAVSHTYLGPVGSSEVNSIMMHGDILLSSSRYESFGGTLVEGMASGCIPVAFGGDGRVDIIQHLESGYLAQPMSFQDLANGIEWAVNVGANREKLHDVALRCFSPQVVAGRYIELIKALSR